MSVRAQRLQLDAAELREQLRGVGVGFASPVFHVREVAQAILYSTMGIVCKFMLGTGMTTQQVMLARFSFTVVLLGAFLLLSRRERLFSRNPLTWVMGVLFFFSAYLYYIGVDLLTAGMAIVIYFVFPVVVAALIVAAVILVTTTKKEPTRAGE